MDEPDNMFKMTKSYLNMTGQWRESSVCVPKTLAGQLENSGADVKGKLKMSWPPEKKSTGFESLQRAYEKNKMADGFSDNNQLKVSYGGEMQNKMKTLSRSFISGEKERPKAAHSEPEKIPPKEIKSRSDPTKAVSYTHLPIKENYPNVPKQTTEPKNQTPISKTKYNIISDRKDADPNKGRRSVRFGSNVDVAQHRMS